MDKKQEELQKMYALRAGLSFISQKCDIVENNELKESQLNTRIKDLASDIQQKEWNIEDEESKIKINNSEARRTILPMILFLLFSGIPIILAIFVYISKINNWVDDSMAFIIFLMVILLIVSIFLFLKFIFRLIYCKDCLNEAKKCFYSVNEMRSYAKELRGDLINAEAELDNKKILFSNVKKEIGREVEIIDHTLVSIFGTILDKRDWENLDLIIYYYETGRADSVKEALQLVDKEKRNDALVEAIGIATNEICQSIHFLGKVIIQGFSSLSAQLEAQRAQIAGAMSAILTQQTLNNALLAKANVSSKQMVEQMKTLNNKLEIGVNTVEISPLRSK